MKTFLNYIKPEHFIIPVIFALFIGGAIYAANQPIRSNDNPHFTGIDAAGFKHGAGVTSTIINH